MTLAQASLLILVVPPILFVVIAALVRPPWRVIGLALVAGLAVGGVNMLGDAAAHALGLWSYPFTEAAVAPPQMYLNSVLFYGAGVIGLLGWWIRRRWGRQGALIFLLAFPLFALARDAGGSAVADASGSLIVWGPGPGPYLFDLFLWAAMTWAGFFTLHGLEKLGSKK